MYNICILYNIKLYYITYYPVIINNKEIVIISQTNINILFYQR